MSVGPQLSRKRWGGGGLLLLALLAILLMGPLLGHRGMNHPLADSQLTDLCPLLPPAPTALHYPHPKPQPGAAANASCQYWDDRGELVLSVSMSSTRQLSKNGPARSDRMFEGWMKEVRASYGNGAELAGDWKQGGAWHDRDRQSVIFEDGGVMVVLESARLDAAALAAHARLVQKSLRQAGKK